MEAQAGADDLDAVLLYAQAGSGRRANLFTDYTFGIWGDGDPPVLVSFAKAYSGLNDAEILELDRWIRRNTLQRFGPARSVKAELVFEIGFEGIHPPNGTNPDLLCASLASCDGVATNQLEEADCLDAARQLMTMK